ncbi:Hypothetical predicted protein, partial [Olea europaea subsp. europaea]
QPSLATHPRNTIPYLDPIPTQYSSHPHSSPPHSTTPPISQHLYPAPPHRSHKSAHHNLSDLLLTKTCSYIPMPTLVGIEDFSITTALRRHRSEQHHRRRS